MEDLFGGIILILAFFVSPGHSFTFKGGNKGNGIEKSEFGILAMGNNPVWIIHSWAKLFTPLSMKATDNGYPYIILGHS